MSNKLHTAPVLDKVETVQRDGPKHQASVLEKLGPGLITGAADDDPSGIATYSQAGAHFGNTMLWTLVFTYPLMAGIQIISARLGRVTGYGLAGIMRNFYAPAWLYTLVCLLLIANTINIAADISAMGNALALVLGGPRHFYAAGLGLVCCLLQVFISYNRYVRGLKWLTLSLFAYVGIVFAVPIPWPVVMKDALWPSINLGADHITMIVAIFGTTISPYLFFWQASQEVEDLNAVDADKPLRGHPEQAGLNLKRIKIDTLIGMGFSNLIAFFIMLTAAAALHQHGITDIQTSTQAAEALRPIAGRFAFVLFALGILGTGMLSIPVLAGSAAFAVAEAFGWRQGLNLNPRLGMRFYGIIVAATLIGIALGFTKLDSIKALFWSAVINGIISVPVMAMMMRMAVNPKVMGQFVISRRLRITGWLATIIMAFVVLLMFAQLVDLGTLS
ncbi:NRAMP (Natural resistance-associated macrophage protein) metal ion transporters [Candidatus Methylobacter favarea]|uniref:NRAMP (Natural resistance-associated macrophage protein) metal ion transporters n=1 Tax=Candidatus Methylobacter favarea TaxID=2707345 RepID=A0A8S0X2U4_9GAMM|nr:divalent metal cation transporter [Candidatus Methylobacter favarea]CAA9892204.1 NRAMP (Natural resistance-associated macrophage protein) metal ion transporters [Candidatus Methylobacter favarea]